MKREGHTFDHLGAPPFKCVAAYDIPGNGGNCDHCNTYIKTAYLIASSDQKKFRVGNKCVLKTGDPSLQKDAKKFKRLRDSERRKERRKAENDLFDAEERERNGGLTDSELFSKLGSLTWRLREVLLEEFIPLVGSGSEFTQSISDTLSQGDIPRGRGVEITLDIIAKTAGVEGSLGYQELYNRASKTFEIVGGLHREHFRSRGRSVEETAVLYRKHRKHLSESGGDLSFFPGL